jgi:Leucine-rich repeat (LRR) protein
LTTPELEVLGLANTGLTGKPSFPVWSKLKVLDLSYNSINDVFAVGELKDLEKLNLAHNKISNFAPILGIAVSGNPRDAKLLPWLHELNSEGNPVPHQQVVPSGYAIDALQIIGTQILLDHQFAEKNYSKVAQLSLGSGQVVEDIQCLKVYYHYKHIGVLNSILPAFPMAGTLNDNLVPICKDSNTTGCVKALYGQDLESCTSYGKIGDVSPTIKPIIDIGNTSDVKISTSLNRITGNAKRELQEVKSIRDLINRLGVSQNNSEDAVDDAVEGFKMELERIQERAVAFLDRIDRIRVANHVSLQNTRSSLLQTVQSEKEGS